MHGSASTAITRRVERLTPCELLMLAMDDPGPRADRMMSAPARRRPRGRHLRRPPARAVLLRAARVPRPRGRRGPRPGGVRPADRRDRGRAHAAPTSAPGSTASSPTSRSRADDARPWPSASSARSRSTRTTRPGARLPRARAPVGPRDRPRRTRCGRPDRPADGGQRLQRHRDRRGDRPQPQRHPDADVPLAPPAPPAAGIDRSRRMIDHDRAQELAAAALDFDLSAADRTSCAGTSSAAPRVARSSDGLGADARGDRGACRPRTRPIDLRARILDAAIGRRRCRDRTRPTAEPAHTRALPLDPAPLPPARGPPGERGGRRRPDRRHAGLAVATRDDGGVAASARHRRPVRVRRRSPARRRRRPGHPGAPASPGSVASPARGRASPT